jgi:hypothetical protein
MVRSITLVMRIKRVRSTEHDLLDQGYPFLMEEPMGINAPEVKAVAAKAARLDASVAVPTPPLMVSGEGQVHRLIWRRLGDLHV